MWRGGDGVTVDSDPGRVPPIVPGGVIEPYTPPEPFFIGPLDEAIARQTAILRAGAYTTPPQLHPLDNGRVLLVTEVIPGQHPTTPAGPVSRLARLSPYLLAGGAVLAAVTTAVLLFLFAIGLHALVQWGIANALTIGAVVAFGVVAALVFLSALAKARHGHHGRRY